MLCKITAMTEKISIITGANSGIGFETAKALAKLGATVVLICRNQNKGFRAVEAIKQVCGHEKVELFIADLAEQQQIREAAATISNKYPKIDVLVNNAGTWFSEYQLSPDGIETVFAVNHLAYVLLTHLLWPCLAKSPDARIINISSDSHFKGTINFDDIGLSSNYHGLRSYAQSKLANVLFTYELDRRKPIDHCAVNAVQPGLVYTDIGLKHTSWFHSFAWKVRRGLWKSLTPEEGAQTSIYLASHPEAKGQSGKYWDKCKAKLSSPISYDEDTAARLWELSLECCGIGEYWSRKG